MLDVNRGDRRTRRAVGKSDTVDAETAARSVLAGQSTAIPKTADGALEMMRQGTVKLTSGAHNCRSMADFPHLSGGTRHLIPHTEGASPQQAVVGRPKQVATDTEEVEHEAVHG